MTTEWSEAPDRVERALRELTAETGRPPTVREIAAAAGRSVSTVAYHLRALEQLGIVSHTPHHSRSYRLAW
ncbi:ArsR family transcriptional regulator [Streptomyces sp. CT34]|uniref:LexA family protein n=1 Tax=Streptomyces sp. CT34 TaxID=1553907 RepID=UPI0005B8D0AD|nr:ArsR family transcriptional regulator [Streptomyces sp. CT34]